MRRNLKIPIGMLVSFMVMGEELKAAPLVNTEMGYSDSISILVLLTILTLAPSILIMMTCFTRFIISLHFLKSALGTPQMPPNQIVVGLALFLTFFVMSPVFSKINTDAIVPLTEGKITQEVALEKAGITIKEFMLKQTREEDIKLFMDMAQKEAIETVDEVSVKLPLSIVVPAFILSELRAGFMIGFLIYLPFIAIDMVVSSTLMAMGMMMLPPATIALPFKIILFILADGWHLLVEQLIHTIN